MEGFMKAFRVLDIAGAGMTAERKRLDVVAANIANANTQLAENGEPYRRQEVVFRSVLDAAARRDDRIPMVEVAEVVPDMSPFERVFKGEGFPGADRDGYVMLPNVDIVFEMVDLMEAMRSYEANLRSVRAFRQMFQSALEIGRGA